MHHFRAALKIFIFLLSIVICIPPQAFMAAFTRGKAPFWVCIFWHRLTCRVFGIRLSTEGLRHNNGQTLFVSNHISYLDISALTAVIGPVSFLAKSEVASWPLFGLLAKLQKSAFISRRRTAIREEAAAFQKRLAEGNDFIAFPEGTSTDGQTVRPFKPGIFSILTGGAADAKPMAIQPVTIRMMSVDGRLPDTQKLRDLYAWHIGMDTPLAAHMWRFAKTRGAHLKIIFHAPVQAIAYDDRKTLAQACHQTVSAGLAA